MTAAARPPAFVFDPASCVGCHACAIACVNEHQLAPGAFWRQVVSFNPARVPGLPTWHVSVACNHCLDAPCLRYCPAKAIARDDRTGAVLIDDRLCMGCRYCSWVCPYDAPRFDPDRGVMQKCTFCAHRLATGLTPACAGQCPTGALSVGPLEGEGTRGVPGFPRAEIRPAVRFVSRRWLPADAAPGAGAGGGADTGNPAEAGSSHVSADDSHAPAIDETVSPAVHMDWAAATPPAPKLSLRREWSLVAFTLIAVVNVAWVTGALLGGPGVHAAAFLAMGVAAVALSTSHLGQPRRAWRAALNWRHSWLSREVTAWPAFLGIAGPWAAAWPAWTGLGWIAAAAGAVCLACVDRVYAVMARPRRPVLDDGAAVSAALFLAAVMAAWPALAVAAGAYRLAAYLQRARGRDGATGGAVWRHPALRLGTGLLVPAVAWVVASPLSHAVAVAGALVGEAIDRADFYASLDVDTPAAAMARATRDALGREARPAA